MKTAPLNKVAHLSMGTAPPGSTYNTDGVGTPMIAGAGDYGETYPKAKKWTTAPTRIAAKGDLIVCVRATIGDLNWADQTYCLGRGVAGLRPRKNKLDIRYLAYFIEASKRELTALGTGSTFLAIRKSDLEELAIPIPFPDDAKRSLSEQRRIAGILDQADAIRRQRRAALAQLNTLIPALFHDMFGDLQSNSKGIALLPLSTPDLVEFVSGGTPSKSNPEYWNGDFPWVSPKDMKVDVITSAQDHVSDEAFRETTLKRIPSRSILIVVRGMILVHTAPIALTDVDVAINQDMKAILLRSETNALFLLWSLKSQQKYILSRVSTAAHGTKRLEVSEVKALLIPDVSNQVQSDFGRKAEMILDMIRQARSSLLESDALFHSLVQRAFRGAL